MSATKCRVESLIRPDAEREVLVGSGVTVAVYVMLTLAFCRAGATIARSSGSDTLKFMVSETMGEEMLQRNVVSSRVSSSLALEMCKREWLHERM